MMMSKTIWNMVESFSSIGAFCQENITKTWRVFFCYYRHKHVHCRFNIEFNSSSTVYNASSSAYLFCLEKNPVQENLTSCVTQAQWNRAKPYATCWPILSITGSSPRVTTRPVMHHKRYISFQLAMEEYMHIMAGISLEHLLTQPYNPEGLWASFGNKNPQKSPLRTPFF